MIKRILFLIVVLVILIVGIVQYLHWLFPTFVPEPTFVPGPTCDTYYVNNNLRVCPDKYEFNHKKRSCVPIDETGCTAALEPTTITASEASCTNRQIARLITWPCQVVLDCNRNIWNGMRVAREGYCFRLNDDDEFEEVECMQVPGCRHLDLVHVPTQLVFDDTRGSDELRCSNSQLITLNNEVIPLHPRDTAHPCISTWTCFNNQVSSDVCIFTSSCKSDTAMCANCANFERCKYLNAYTPVAAIVNSS
ncbi:agse18 [Agrotis ipsilon multiple nucleopolyhedrovirus]|uniref:Uncharacterized protein n=1 Tax=Agrotis ipsilon multiple nucleopolyhedrovirus TaxID=208013 RepID=B6D5T2_9ABAC|nr:agse18 [Agrotis ipsilon multiple nucleopolyhedrovirus]ACI28720.1 unknown [Agrotis ipsilon multiple nucleopolyhedrovirus]